MKNTYQRAFIVLLAAAYLATGLHVMATNRVSSGMVSLKPKTALPPAGATNLLLVLPEQKTSPRQSLPVWIAARNEQDGDAIPRVSVFGKPPRLTDSETSFLDIRLRLDAAGGNAGSLVLRNSPQPAREFLAVEAWDSLQGSFQPAQPLRINNPSTPASPVKREPPVPATDFKR